MGYALVESWTADLYVMTLNTTGAMVGRAVIPDPDIPPDRNIITFPMDPHYVKNGTLDGKVGLVNDPDYREADFSRGSYFQVEEAVLLKQQIEKRIAEADAAYENFDAAGRGKEAKTDLGEAAERTPFDVDADRARENLMNMYVWDANGGLHSETQQVSGTRTTTVAAVFKSSHQGGIAIDLKVGIVGPASNFDFLAGAQLDVTVSKSEAVAGSFGLAVNVVGDPLLQSWDPTANSGQGAYSADPCPGKVKDYRFASFYLAPATANSDEFLKIIEPGWYYSSDPDAIALRSARIEGTPSWRVLHRVTYVSRVPPRFEQQPAVQSGSASGRLIDEQDNSWLIALVLAELGNQVATPGQVAAALAVVMNPPATSPGVYPPSKVSAYVPWWDDFLKKTRGAQPDVAALELLMRCQHDALAYLMAGLDSGQIADPSHKTGARMRIRQLESPAKVHHNRGSAAPVGVGR
jgi:large repetitive protein